MLVGLLLVVHAAQWSIGLTIADTALVSGATSSGQWVSQGTALVLAGGGVPCLVVGRSRWRAAARRERRTPV